MAFSNLVLPSVAPTEAGGAVASGLDKIYRNQLLAAQAQYYGPSQQANIANTQAQTNKLNVMTPLEAVNQQNVNDWYGRKAASDIALQNAQGGYYGSEANLNNLKYRNPGLLGGDDAQLLALAQMQQGNQPSGNTGGFVPQQNAVQPQPQTPSNNPVANMSLTPQAQQSLSANNLLNPPQAQQRQPQQMPAGQNEVANYAKQLLQAKIAQTQGMANYYNQGGPQLGVGAKEVRNFQNQLMQEYGLNPSQALEASNAYMSGKTTLSDGTQLPPPSSLDQESMNRIVKEGTTSAGVNQIRSDTILDTLFKQGDELMPNASKFAGLFGKSNQTIEKFASSLGKDDPAYQDYITFTRQTVPQLANQMLSTEGARFNNTQKAMMMSVANPITFDQHPESSMKQWQYLTKTFRQNVGPAISQGVSQQRQNLQAGGQQGERVRVTSPDGKSGTIPSANLQKALQQGYKQVS